MIKYIMIIIYGILGSMGMYFLKSGLSNETSFLISKGLIKLTLNFKFIIGFILYVASFLLYMFIISKNNLMYIIPLATAALYIFILIISIFLLKEPLTIYKTIGFFLILIGVILINLK